MAETKTYKGKKNEYYEGTGGRFDYLTGPIDKTNTLGMQNEPNQGPNLTPDQFGRKDSKSEDRP